MQGKVEISYVNTKNLPRLSGEETDALPRRARSGGPGGTEPGESAAGAAGLS